MAFFLHCGGSVLLLLFFIVFGKAARHRGLAGKFLVTFICAFLSGCVCSDLSPSSVF